MDEIQVEDQWGSWGKLANPSRAGWQRPFDRLRANGKIVKLMALRKRQGGVNAYTLISRQNEFLKFG